MKAYPTFLSACLVSPSPVPIDSSLQDTQRHVRFDIPEASSSDNKVVTSGEPFSPNKKQAVVAGQLRFSKGYGSPG